jgi:carbonic anhydrase/acetyltransferase-like protein (isoleucine patch superfamily)
MADKNTIKNWFKTGLKPTQPTWDSFWHKDEKIPIMAIDDIENILNEKADAEVLAHLQVVVDNIQLPSAIGVLEKTKAEIDVLIASNGLIPGTLYKITGVHPTLYNDGVLPGTTIYLQALTNSIFSERGYGEFWNPKYNQSLEGYGIWTNLSSYDASIINGIFVSNENITSNNGATGRIFGTIESNQFIVLSGISESSWEYATSITGNTSGATANITGVVVKSYSINSKVIWGGYSWTNINGNIGSPSNILHLNNEWIKDAYSIANYDQVLDVIEYDYTNDWINRRFEVASNNDVKNSRMTAEWYDNEAINAINSFQFGNPINNVTYLGVGVNRVLDSYFECVNFRGQYIFNNIVEAGSSIKNNLMEKGSTIESNTLRGNCNIKDNICSRGYIYDNTLIGHNSEISNNVIVFNSSILGNMINNGSRISINSIKTGSSIGNNNLDGSSRISNCHLEADSLINQNNLSLLSKINSVKLITSTIIYSSFEKIGILQLGLNYPLSVKIIQLLNVEGGVIMGDLMFATIVFSNYSKTAYARPDGLTKIRYYNDFDTMVIADITD